MEVLLKYLGLMGIVVVFVIVVVALIILFRVFIQHSENAVVLDTYEETLLEQKKYTDVNVDSYEPVIINLAIIISLAFVLAIFEFPFSEKESLITLQSSAITDYEEMQEIPLTEHLPPPPPQIQQPEIIIVANNEEIEEEININLDVEMDEETIVEDLIAIEKIQEEEEEPEEAVDKVFLIVEQPAEPIGGYKAFYTFIAKNITYPKKAQRLGIEGKVYLQFVVNPKGEFTNIKVVKGIGGGCDEEAVRILKLAPKWKAGKQRGRKVRQQLSLPIAFKMQ